MIFSIEMLIIIGYFVWLIILTILFIKFYLYYSLFLKNDGKKTSIISVLDDLLQKDKQFEVKLKEINKKQERLEDESLLHIQKIGLLRFNPFKDTGGDQSFILALLDAQNTGVVVSSLHTRSGTRWYAKRVIAGKGVEYDLSDDEKKALEESKSLKTIN